MKNLDSIDEDELLMLRVSMHDVGAFEELLHKYSDISLKVIKRMIGNSADAEDIVQDFFLKIWSNAEIWQPQAKFKTWLFRVLFNAVTDYWRKQKKHSELDDELSDHLPSALDILIKTEAEQAIKIALDHLPYKQRAVLVLCYYENFSNAEAAEILFTTTGAVQALLFRARNNLKNMIASNFDRGDRKNGTKRI